jgi:hypothetical protein
MKSARGFKIAAVVLLGATILYWLYASLAAIIGGNSRAVSVLIQMILAGILVVVAWKWPLPGGIAMTLLAAALAMYYLLAYYSLDQVVLPLVFVCLPMAIGGLLFIEADWTMKRAQRDI